MTGRKRSRYVLVAVLMGMLFNYPLLSTANRKVLVLGVPLLYVYIGIAWVLCILLLYITSNTDIHRATKRDE